jgi:hypothetical protein
LEVIYLKNGPYILIVAPPDWEGKKYRDRYCYEHHYVYWKNTEIYPDYDNNIHHKDGDKHNNDFSNLELIKRSEHASKHNKEYGRKYVLIECPNCLTQIERLHSSTHLSKKGTYTCCSLKCSGELSNKIKKGFKIERNVLKIYKKYQE